MAERAHKNTLAFVWGALKGVLGMALTYYTVELDGDIANFTVKHANDLIQYGLAGLVGGGGIASWYQNKPNSNQNMVAGATLVPSTVQYQPVHGTAVVPPVSAPTESGSIVHDLERFHNYEDFTCPCNFESCDKAVRMPDELYRVLIDVSDHFGGASIYVSSGQRCKEHNSTLPNASDKSQHILERACDFVLLGINPAAVHEYLLNKYPDRYGIGEYRKFTHIDIKPGRRRRW